MAGLLSVLIDPSASSMNSHRKSAPIVARHQKLTSAVESMSARVEERSIYVFPSLLVARWGMLTRLGLKDVAGASGTFAL